jgi:UDP-N-acetylglucosamine pyrophosphorylase
MIVGDLDLYVEQLVPSIHWVHEPTWWAIISTYFNTKKDALYIQLQKFTFDQVEKINSLS